MIELPPGPEGITTDVVLARANKFAHRMGWRELTNRMLRDWLDEHLVPNPKPSSRGYATVVYRFWSAISYRRVLRLLKLKHLGARRYTELRLALWLRGIEFPEVDVRNAFNSEFTRISKRLARPLPVAWAPHTRQPVQHQTEQAVMRHTNGGDLALLNYSDLVRIRQAASLFFGVKNLDTAKQTVDELFEHYGIKSLPARWDQLKNVGVIAIESMTGILANPAEFGTIIDASWIVEIDFADFRETRQAFSPMKYGLQHVDALGEIPTPLEGMFQDLSRALMYPRWEIIVFCALLRAIPILKVLPQWQHEESQQPLKS